MKKLFLIAACLAFLSACFYDNASEMYPAASLNQNCDTLNVTYDDDLVPLFKNYCGTNSGCHSPGGSGAPVILDNYEDAKNVDDITMMESIQHVPGSIFMPPSGKMSDCGIKQVELWILNGKPEN